MKKSFLWLFAALAIIISCTKKPKHLSYIPSNSIGVLALDINSVGKKSITVGDFIKSFSSKDTLAEQIKNSGIDILNSFYLFGSGNNQQDMEFGALFSVDDTEKFEQFVLTQFKIQDKKFVSKGDIKYIIHREGVVGYKGDVGLALFSKTNLEARIAEILSAKEENTLIGTNKNFEANLKTSADVKFWLDYGKVSEFAKQNNNAAAALGFNDFKNSYLNTDINFEDGKIVGNYHFDASKETIEKLSKLSKPSVNAALVNSHPGNDLILAYAAGYNLKELAVQYPVLKSVDASLERVSQGLTYDKLAEIFSGDIVATINGVRIVQKEKYDYVTDSTYMAPEPSVDFAVSLGIADNNKLTPVLDSLVSKGLIIKNGDNYAIIGGTANLFVKQGYIQIVGFKEYAEQIAAGKTAAISGESSKLLTANASALTVDFTKIKPEAVEAFGKDFKEVYDIFTIENIVFKGYKPEKESSKGDFEINFRDKSQNSLRSLGKMVTELSNRAEAKRKKQEEELRKLQESLQDTSATGLVDTVSSGSTTELP
ncbi:MAG TPA: hypothetical protein VL947_08990 [Cytophagales bacterium]|nr:hypothetical protein [Cytophagales bacterium]